MKRIAAELLPLLALGMLTGFSIVWSQAPVDYSDVAVIINEESDISIEIGEYFAGERSIPDENIIRISVPTSEVINDTEFEDLRSQVESYLTTTGLDSVINYIVTTKGCPLKVNRPAGDPDNPATTARRASIESELMLILGAGAQYIGGASWLIHNYGGQSQRRNFYRREHGFYLTTRLDAYTKEDVVSMIDRSGPYTMIEKDSVLFVMDQDPGPRDQAFHQSQSLAANVLTQRGWNVLLNTDSVYVTDQRNVMGYSSWGSNDRFDHHYAEHAIPRNTWSPGSLAETFVSTSGRSFRPGTGYGQSLIADWIAEGVTGAKGYVYEPFTVALAFPHVMCDRYTDVTIDTSFNLAESFYMASRTLSWMEVVLGDPKTSIITEMPAIPSPDLPDTVRVCVGDATPLTAVDVLRGIRYWFAGDTSEILSANTPLDKMHPQFVSHGNTIFPNVSQPGTATYSFLNRNISGDGWDQVVVDIVPEPDPIIYAEADSVKPGQGLRFADASDGVVSRTWQFGDDTESEDSTVVHIWDEEGTYTVRLSISNGTCSRSITKAIVVSRETSGVEENREGSAQSTITISAVPVPADDYVEIMTDHAPVAEALEVRLCDVGGTVLQSHTIRADLTKGYRISLQEYPDGIYFVQVFSTQATTSIPIVVRNGPKN